MQTRRDEVGRVPRDLAEQANGNRGTDRKRESGAQSAEPAAEAIPDIVIRRLPIYVRTLGDLHGRGIRSVSSDELAGHIGVTAAQIRRDLSYFGRFGKQGKGYDTEFLAREIAKILRLDRPWDVALAGFGNLGGAVVHYRGSCPPRSTSPPCLTDIRSALGSASRESQS